MKDITLKITGKQVYDNKEENQMEFITDGKVYLKNDSVYIVYDESEVSGFTGCKTTLKLKDDSVKMKRIGDKSFGTELFFKEGERFKSSYNTPYGDFDIEVLTNIVKNDIDIDSLNGKVNIEYQISLDGLREGKNTLTIDLM